MEEDNKPPEDKASADASRDKKSLKKKYYTVSFYLDWCKACGICIAFCPKQIIKASRAGKPFIEEEDKCIGCRFCEIHCPDFAINVRDRFPKRRKTDV